MGEGLTEDALDVGKQPALIEEAQKDIQALDVLVCGKCHEVFHFSEALAEHKEPGKCTGSSEIRKVCQDENKAQVWAFALWKHKQIKVKNEDDGNPTTWLIYQRWCKLPQDEKDVWIAAGNALQWQEKIASAKVTEAKQTSQDTLEDGKADKSSDDTNKNLQSALRTVKAVPEQYVVEKILAKRFTPRRKTWEYKIKWENFPEEESTWEPIAHLESCKSMVDEFEENLRRLKVEKAKQSMVPSSPRSRGRPRLATSPSPSVQSTDSVEKNLGPRPQRTSKQKALSQVKAWCGNTSDGDEATSSKRPFEDDSSDDSFGKKIKLEAESEDTEDDTKKSPKKSNKSVNNGLQSGSKLPDNVLIPDSKGVVRINQKQLPSLSSGVYIMSKTAGIIKLDSATSKIATSGGQAIVKVAPKIGQTHIKIVKKDGETTSKIIPMSQGSPSKLGNKPIKVYKANSGGKAKPKMPIEKPKPKPAADKPDVSSTVSEPKESDSDSDYGLADLEFPPELSVPDPESPPGDFILDPITGKVAGKEYPEHDPEPVIHPIPEPGPLPEVKPDADTNTMAENSLDNLVKLAAADITEDDLQPLPDNSSNSLSTNVEEAATMSVASTASVVTQVVKSEPGLTSEPENVEETRTELTGIMETRPPPLTTIQKSVMPTGTILQQTLQRTVTPRPKVQQRILNQSVAAKSGGNYSPIVRPMPSVKRIVTTPRPKFQISGQSRYTEPTTTRITYAKGTIPRKIGSTTIYKSVPTVRREPPKPIIKKVAVYQSPSPVVKTPAQYRTHTVYKSSPVFKASTPFNTRKSSGPFKTSQAVYNTTTSYRTVVSQRKEPQVHLNSSPGKSKRIISMPSLSGDEDASHIEDIQAEPAIATTRAATQVVTTVASSSTPAEESPAETDISAFTLPDSEAPIFITGDDGTVYQVAGQNEQGQTILITQGADGQQQCLLVTSEATSEEAAASQPETPVAQVAPEVQDPLTIKTDTDASDQVVAQVVRAEPPSPGGTHKVVVMLPDGHLMVTQVTPEEYASLELDK